MNCIFSENEADNEEHVIPKWLQRKYQLYNQHLTIPNKTSLPYSKIKIPVNTIENATFGRIEKNISEGIYRDDELYLWAFKIHIGLLQKDCYLKANRNKKESEMIFNQNDFDKQAFLFKNLYKSWKEGMVTKPSAIGSVLLLDSAFTEDAFDFVHCIKTNTVMMVFNRKLLVVYLYDHNDAKNANIQETWYDYYLSKAKANRNIESHYADEIIAHRVFSCENAYHTYKRFRDLYLEQTANGFRLRDTEMKLRDNYSKEEYSEICNRFGLILLEYNDFINNKYTLKM